MNGGALRLIFALFGLGLSLWSIEPGLSLRQCVRELWQSDRGLPQNSIQGMIQSRDGYVWLATQEGLARFDGLRFTLFSRADHPRIPYNYIRTLLEDRRGRVWAGTNEGGLFFVSLDGEVTARPEPLPGDVRALHEDASGRIWIGLSRGGLACLEGESLRLWGAAEGFPAEQVLALASDGKGRLLVGSNRGIFFGEPPFTPWAGNERLPSLEVNALLWGGEDEWWVGTRAGLLHWRGGRTRVYDSGHDLGFDWVWCLLRDRNDSIWVGGNGGGLARIIAGEVRERLTIETGLHDNGVWSLLEDREGGLWVGGNGGGLARYRPGLFINLGREEGLGNGPYAAVCQADDGSMWVGTWWDGCYIVSDRGIRHLTTAQGLPDNNISSLCADGAGGMWLGTDNGGLAHLDREGRCRVLDSRQGLAHNEVYALARGPDGTLWVGSLTGVQGRRGQGWLPGIPGLEEVGARSLLVLPDNSLWIGSEGRGLCRWLNGELKCWTRREGLPSDKIFALCADGHGGLWIGSQGGGLSHLDASGRLLGDALPQLSGSPVFQILEDGGKGLWLSGNRGLTVLAAQEADRLRSHHLLDGPVRLLGLAEGMASEECTGGFQPAGCRARDGRLYWPTLRSVAVFDPGRQVKNRQPPLICIEELSGDGREYRPGDGAIFPAGTKTVIVRYAAVSHNNPRRVSCRYRLEGFDSDWRKADPPASRLISYTNLPPGKYRLHIEAVNEDAVKSANFSGLAFSVRPFFFQTWSFRVLALLGFMFVSYFLVSGIRRYLYLLAFWRKEKRVGAYLLEEVLGSGGSATVYRARHLLIRSRVVALKLLREEYARDPVQSRRFREEAALIDRLNHPGIVRVIERGSHGSTFYMAMEYLEGQTLAQRLKGQVKVAVDEALAILGQLAVVLAFLHEKGIVHRDLKPRNIMLTGSTVKLLDFGIAKAFGHTAMTETGIVMGTLAYLSPEQLRQGQSASPGDIYALGVIAWEMITGRLPYTADSGAALMREIVSVLPDPPKRLCPECPDELSVLVLEMLDKDPGRRPTAAEIISRLDAVKIL